MKAVAIFLGASICLGTICELPAKDIRTPGNPNEHRSITSKGKKHGEFLMIGRGAKKSILLSNNIFYRPAHDHDAKHTLDWQIRDPIRVLKTKKKKNFILLNQRTGETMKGKILNWS